jgi:hypothetical protein
MSDKEICDIQDGERTVCCWASIESDCVVVSLYQFAAVEFVLGYQNDV